MVAHARSFFLSEATAKVGVLRQCFSVLQPLCTSARHGAHKAAGGAEITAAKGLAHPAATFCEDRAMQYAKQSSRHSNRSVAAAHFPSGCKARWQGFHAALRGKPDFCAHAARIELTRFKVKTTEYAAR